MQELEKAKMKTTTDDEAIRIPAFLDLSAMSTAAHLESLASCTTYCERVQCQDMCMALCQNCLGITACQSSCQNGETCSWCQGNSCEAYCQNCLGTATCQNGEGCVNCQGAVCQTCQNCLGVPCQSGQGCQVACEASGQTVYSPATFSISNITDTSATFTISAGQGYQNVRLLVRLYDDPSDLTYDSSNPTGDGPIVALPMPAKTLDITVTKFQPSTHYAANVHSFGGTSGRGEAGLQDFRTDAAETKVEPWSWSVSNGSATDAQTQAAYNAVMNKGSLNDFSYLVWNDLVSKVYETATAAGKQWLTNDGTNTYLSLDDTYMGINDKALTAARFNALRYNVGARVSTGISNVRAGDQVLGSYFDKITRKLNEWIGLL